MKFLHNVAQISLCDLLIGCRMPEQRVGHKGSQFWLMQKAHKNYWLPQQRPLRATAKLISVL